MMSKKRSRQAASKKEIVEEGQEFDLQQPEEGNDSSEEESGSSGSGSGSGSDSDVIASCSDISDEGEEEEDDNEEDDNEEDGDEEGDGDLGSEDELVPMSGEVEGGVMPAAFAPLNGNSTFTAASHNSNIRAQADFEEYVQYGKGKWNTRDDSSSSPSSKRIYKGMEKREEELANMKANGTLESAKFMHLDDLSSDDEEAGNTIGNVPLHWYDDHDHIGYGLDGKKIARRARGDGLDRYLDSKDDPNFRRTVYDAKNDREVVLSDRQMELIRNILSGGYAHPEFNDHQEFVPFFSQNVQIHPLVKRPAPKHRFVPDSRERQKVLKIAQAIREGRIVIGEKKEKKQDLYMMWGDDESSGFVKGRKAPPRLAMPKMALPGHKESYNPPSEYLLDEKERKEWEEQDPDERKDNFIPSKYPSLKMVPGYKNYCNERFERCRDLYWASRKRVNRLNIKPESLLPRIPDVEELKPFPTHAAIEFEGHNEHKVRCLTVSPNGQWLASGNDNGEILLHEVSTGRLMCRRNVASSSSNDSSNHDEKKTSTKKSKKSKPSPEDKIVHCIRWNPNPLRSIVAVCVGKVCHLIKVGMSTKKILDNTNNFMDYAMNGGGSNTVEEESDDENKTTNKRKTSSTTTWSEWTSDVPSINHVFEEGATVSLPDWIRAKEVVWHAKGDYFSTKCDAGSKKNVCMVHQLSKCTSAALFRKVDQIQSMAFHPTKPFIFLATLKHVHVYSLSSPVKLKKKLKSSAKHMSSIVVHPSGDHILIGMWIEHLFLSLVYYLLLCSTMSNKLFSHPFFKYLL